MSISSVTSNATTAVATTPAPTTGPNHAAAAGPGRFQQRVGAGAGASAAGTGEHGSTSSPDGPQAVKCQVSPRCGSLFSHRGDRVRAVEPRGGRETADSRSRAASVRARRATAWPRHWRATGFSAAIKTTSMTASLPMTRPIRCDDGERSGRACENPTLTGIFRRKHIRTARLSGSSIMCCQRATQASCVCREPGIRGLMPITSPDALSAATRPVVTLRSHCHQSR